MSLAKLVELGISEKQILNVAVAYIATKDDGSIDKDMFMRLAGYTSWNSAQSNLSRSRTAMKAVGEKLAGDEGGGDKNSATPLKRKTKAGKDLSSAKKPKVAGGKKLDMLDALDDEELGGGLIKPDEEGAGVVQGEEHALANILADKSHPVVKEEPDDLV